MTDSAQNGVPVRPVRIMGIRGRLFLAFGGVFVILLAIYLLAGSTFDHYIETSGRVMRDDVDSIIAARDMRDAVDNIAETAGQSRREGIPVDFARVDAAKKAFDQAVALQLSRVTLPGEGPLTQEIQSGWERIRTALAAVPGAAEVDRAAIIQGRLMPVIREIRPMITRLSEMNAQGIKSRHGGMREATATAHRTLHAVLVLGLIGVTVFATFMGRHIVRPLAAMTVSANAIARGDLERELPVKSRDELGQLAATFNQMMRELKRFRALDADRLQRAYQTAQTAIDSLPDGVVMFGQHDKVELANETARRLFGIAAGQKDLKSRLPWLKVALDRPGEPPDGYRSSVEVSDRGISRFFLPQLVPLKDGNGQTIGWTLILTDVTAFRTLDQWKDSLLSMASHELKTPLTSMRMILPLLLEQTIGPLNAKQTELVTVTRDATERMRHIVETILDLGRRASGRTPMEMRQAQAADLASGSIRTMRPAFAAKGVELCAEIPQGLAPVRCDPSHMEHVFANLLSNALRHTPAGGNVVVSAHECGAAVRFQVHDTGCGIAPVHLPRLFDTFYRVPGQRSDTGTGLGLALAKQIIESHGGTVGVESVVGGGSTFWFTLPIAPTGGKADDNDNGDDSHPASDSSQTYIGCR